MYKALSISIVLVGISVFYYFVIFLPNQATQKRLEQGNALEQEQAAREEQQRQLQICLNSADFNYSSGWNSDCKARGLEDDCSLPTWNAERWDKRKSDEKELCFKQYPQN